MITGAAAGIIGMLSGQGIMTVLSKTGTEKLEERLRVLEAKELVIKDEEYIAKSTVEEAMTGLATQMQQALNQQAEAMVGLMQQASEENAKAVRIAEARAQATAQVPVNGQANVAAMQQMMGQIESLQRQLGA